ncbi:MAG: hypothetical protein K6E91_11865 [Butyrivibrio sp.]|nr:hypothetical protein [Butyrivibrio sp.]
MRKELLITKRILAGVAAGLVLFIYAAIPSMAMLGGFPSSMYNVSTPSANGVWVYSKTELYEKDDYEYHGEQGGHFNNEYYSSSANEHEEINEVLSSVEENNLAVNIRCHQRNSFSTPPQVLTPQDEVDLKMTNELLDYFCIYPDDWVTKDLGNYENKESCFYYGLEVMFPADEEGYRDRWTPSSGHIEVKQYPGWKIRYRDTSVMNQTNMGHGNVKFSLISPLTSSGEYVLTVPLGSPGDTFILSAHSFHGNMATSWYYEWQEDGTSAVTSTESGDEDVNPQKPYTQEDYTDASTKPGEDKGTDIASEIFEKSDDSSDIPGTIMIGGAGVLVAGGAMGAAGGKKKKQGKKKNDKKKDTKEKSTFKMYINKAFGDALAKGGEPQYVYARIMEVIPGGGEKERNDLTEKISVFSKDNSLDVSDAGMTSNGYKAALVTVPKDLEQTKGMVSFMFAGEGGVYTRNVIFNLVGGNPVIIFPKLADDGVSWIESSWPGEAVFIAGKGGTEKVRFYIKDAVDEPIDIRFDCESDFKVSYEKEPTYKCGYYAVVENLSQEIVKANDIIADMVTKTINVEAEFKDGTVISSEFYVELYPEGLSVIPNTKYFKDDKLQVNTVEETNPKPGEFALMPSSYDVLVCYRNEATGKNVIFKNPYISHEDPDDEGKYKNLFKENFRYRIVNMDVGGYDFYPECSLPMFDEPFSARMKLMYNGKDGSYYDGYLPIDFIGMKSDVPSKVTREQAVKQLKKAIRIFGLGNNQDITDIVRNTSIHSAAQIQFATKYILIAGIDFYMDCSKTYTSFAKQCDRYVVACGCMVKAGDMAIDYMLKVKFGKAGETAATFLNPLKNMYFEYIGQYYGVGADPANYKTEDFEFWKALSNGASDKLEGMMTGEEKPTPEKLGFVVAGYLMVRFVHHYYYGEGTDKGDFYRSLFAAIGDLSFMQFREWVGEQIKKWSGSAIKKLQEWLGQHFTNWYEGAASAAVKAAGDKGFEKVMRDNVKTGIGYAERDAARLARISAEKIELESVYKLMGWSRENYVKGRMDDLDIMAGVALNFMFGGTGNDGDVDDIKASDYAKKALSNFFCKVLGFEIEKIYQVTENITGFSSFRVGPGNTIIFGFKNFEVEISVVKNLEIISNMFFGYCFSWLEKIYEYCTDDSAKVPDARDIMECNTKILDEVLEIVENPEPIVYRDKK